MVAVWTSATMSGVPASVVISQAAPTPCTSQPIEPTRLAAQIARNMRQPQRRQDAATPPPDAGLPSVIGRSLVPARDRATLAGPPRPGLPSDEPRQRRGGSSCADASSGRRPCCWRCPPPRPAAQADAQTLLRGGPCARGAAGRCLARARSRRSSSRPRRSSRPSPPTPRRSGPRPSSRRRTAPPACSSTRRSCRRRPTRSGSGWPSCRSAPAPWRKVQAAAAALYTELAPQQRTAFDFLAVTATGLGDDTLN